MYVRKKLETNKMTGSLLVPLIWNFRTSLMDEATVSPSRPMLLPCVHILLKDFNCHWDDGSGIMTYKESPRYQQQGLSLQQALASALRPRCKMLYGVSDTKHEGVWRTVVQAAADIALAHDCQRQHKREARSRQTKSFGTVSTPSQRGESGRRARSDQDSNRFTERICRGSWHILEHRRDQLLCKYLVRRRWTGAVIDARLQQM